METVAIAFGRLADSVWCLAAMEAEPEGLRKVNLGSRCHTAGMVTAYTRILSDVIGQANGDADFWHPVIEYRVREVTRLMTLEPAATQEEAHARVRAALCPEFMPVPLS